MLKFKTLARSPLQVFIAGAVLVLGVAWPLMGTAQDKSDRAKDSKPHAEHQGKQPAGDQDSGGQKQGSAWWFENYTRGRKQDMGGKGMAHGEGGMGGMTGMTKDKMDAGSMAGDGPSSGMGMMDDVDLMGMMDDDMGMMGTVAIGGAGSKNMNGMGKMKMASSLPGSPGVSHVYHIGATGFFLNHSEHITLSTRQQAALNVVKQKALLSKSTAQRKIEEAEQELWELTGADEPDAAQIQAKVQAIEKLRGEQRMAFIQSVGEAAKVLTDEQRRMLLGPMEPDASVSK
jgi:Spy/CpxP family protein refolding chaperone